MNKSRIYYIIEWAFALAACGYLAYRLVTYEDYHALWLSLSDMHWHHYLALILCVALMPVNMSLEAWRWRTLMNEGVKGLTDEGMNWREAHQQVYYSKLAGLITPWRLGEYPARGLLMANSQESRVNSQESVWARVLSMGAVGSATMTAAIVIAGLGALLLSNLQSPISNLQLPITNYQLPIYTLLVVAVFIALVIALALAPRLLRRWAAVSRRLILRSLGQSLIRLACWCVQLALVLYALGAFHSSLFTLHSSLFTLPIYYLLVTITPNVPIAEAGMRGAWAITVFGSMNAAFAGVLLWAINTLLPCLIWPFFRRSW